MQLLKIQKDTQILLGAPTIPMPKKQSDAIYEIVSKLPEIIEAHLPQCFVIGVMKKPDQVLVVVVETLDALNATQDKLEEELNKVLPKSKHLNIWIMDLKNPFLSDIRNIGYRVFSRTV